MSVTPRRWFRTFPEVPKDISVEIVLTSETYGCPQIFKAGTYKWHEPIAAMNREIEKKLREPIRFLDPMRPIDETSRHTQEDFADIVANLQFKGVPAKEFVSDPDFEKLKFYGPKIMHFYPSDPRPYKKRDFFWRCWDAWRPSRRRQRRAKLMCQETPVKDLLWSIWYWLRYSKEHRAKPWRVVIDREENHAFLSMEEKYGGLTKKQFDAVLNGSWTVFNNRSYQLLPGPSIVHNRCGMRSYNPNDIRERYCGHCHIFMDYEEYHND